MRRKRRSKEPDEKPDESWLLPYADMLTLLFALFIILFAMSDVNAQKYDQLSKVFQHEFSSNKGIIMDSESLIDSPSDVPISADTEDENKGEGTDEDEDEDKDEDEDQNKAENENGELLELRTLEQDIDSYVIANNLSEVLGTKLTDEGLLITISNKISFDSGSAKVKDEGKKIAKEVSKLLYTDPPNQIVISGHADDRPIYNVDYASNWELSVIRAINFMALILEDEEFNPGLFSAKGFGEHQPLVPNTSEENRQKNRRVEVLILPNYAIDVDEPTEE